jgi:hypothetical protein
LDADDSLIGDFGSAGFNSAFGVVILAEKDAQSSWDRSPSQDQYRDATEWKFVPRKFGAHTRLRTLPRVIRPPHAHRFSPDAAAVEQIVPLPWRDEGRERSELRRNDSAFTEPGLMIIAASYGLNWLGRAVSRPGTVPLCVGNVTEALSQMLNGRNGVTMTVDFAMLGDPAPELPKELAVQYVYLEDPLKRLREVRIPPEAHGRQLQIPTFA